MVSLATLIYSVQEIVISFLYNNIQAVNSAFKNSLWVD